jgi:transcription antitermination factor NusG
VPLLKKGPEVFPQDLFDVSPGESAWTVAHTRSRQEKVLARHLEILGIAHYLPQYERQIRRSGRRFLSYLPVFPGYVFLRPEASARVEVFRSGVVVRLLEVRDQDLLHAELRQLRALQEAGAELIPYTDLAVGESVRIVEGPFRGYRGEILRAPSGPRLIVSVSMLRRSVAVEFDRSSLARLEGGSAAEVQSAVA